mmetsp:Transcript_24245/g.56450  ORF Transcript_24245/g.56450 Transcript_24245/m.56450 type:complete len:545 (-) Transcript_24245:3-1637(-)
MLLHAAACGEYLRLVLVLMPAAARVGGASVTGDARIPLGLGAMQTETEPFPPWALDGQGARASVAANGIIDMQPQQPGGEVKPQAATATSGGGPSVGGGSAAPTVTGAPANMRREASRSRPGWTPLTLEQAVSQVVQEPDGAQAFVDEDLKAALVKDADFLTAEARWFFGSRVSLYIGVCTLLGAAVGGSALLVLGRGSKEQGPPVKQAVCLLMSLVLLGLANYWAIRLVGDVLSNLKLVAGQMLNVVVAHMGVDLLVRLPELERNFNEVTGNTWAFGVTNPTDSQLDLTHVLNMVSMNETSIAMIKMKPAPLELAPNSSGVLQLGVKQRKVNSVRTAFAQLTPSDWYAGFASEVMTMSVEGRFRTKDFAAQTVCSLPLRLAELPPVGQWPAAAANRKAVERALVAGLRKLHSNSGRLIALPGASRSILNFQALEVTGPLVTWFKCLMVGLMILCALLSCSLVFCCGRLSTGSNTGEPLEETSVSVAPPATGSDAAPPPSPRAAPAKAVASAPPPTRAPPAGRSYRPPQQQSAPPPGDADEHEF